MFASTLNRDMYGRSNAVALARMLVHTPDNRATWIVSE
jgi:hypothetical protein